MNKYVCIHGHFYQPPRENPWLEEIEVQDSAYPYRDWNERITAECYSPNTAARIINDNKIVDIINNYSKISFNFGPTLLSWLQVHDADTYNSIIEADKISQKKFSGHGSAIAQVYNHIIMPLANKRDKQTQIIWGIKDFEFRFNRKPEGIWLSETAVDIETLELTAEQGIQFSILAPRQAGKIKKLNEQNWSDVSNSRIDPRRAYLCNLPSGKKINLFFYDGSISQDLAFGNLLNNGINLADRLLNTLDMDNDSPQLANIATDGETYGHHQSHGDMALAFCLSSIEQNESANITIYGEYLEKFPPEYEVEIIENTSWSCVHGIERWRNDCGCSAGHEGWNQQWREPLRQALDWLRDSLIPIYEKEFGKFSDDIWKMRDEYIKIILNRDSNNVKKFFEEFGVKDLSEENIVTLLKHLEIQRHALLMYTSCGWFFDEISGIETVQVIQYAARAIQLTKELEIADLENEFAAMLEKTPSNIPDLKNGAVVYEKYVKPAIIDLLRLAAHYAVSSLFEKYSDITKVFCYEVSTEKYERIEAGRIRLSIGKAIMKSLITFEARSISFALLHLGDQNLNGGVRESLREDEYNIMQNELKEAFNRLNIADIILLIDRHFGSHSYTLWHLFKDESRKVFNKIVQRILKEIENSNRLIYENHYPIIQAMKETGTPIPKSILEAVEFVINNDLKNMLENLDTLDLDKMKNIYKEVRKWNIELDKSTLGYTGSERINYLMHLLKEEPFNIELMKEIETSLRILNDLVIELNIWKAQNILFLLSKKHLKNIKKKAEANDEAAKEWFELFKKIEEDLHVRIE